MALSARNQLKGKIKSLQSDGLMAEVVVDVSGQEVVSVITKASAQALGLQKGDEVTVVIKSSEVMIAK
jgi:molybdopterin-binding protein